MLKAASLVAVLAALQASRSASETLKVALPQEGYYWDTGIVEYGAEAGLFKDAGLDIEISYT
jgi:ABC-type nitrate/sulfonate/bicarbonate transport system substrate-binding protein